MAQKYNLKQIYIEYNRKLIAFSMSCKYSLSENAPYVSLYTYSLPEIRNISLVAKLERAKQCDSEYLLDAVFDGDHSLLKNKQEICAPAKTYASYIIETGKKL